MKKQKKNPGGRPSDYTERKANLICGAIATSSLSLRDVCNVVEYNLPHDATVRGWIVRYPEFRDNYARAKTLQAHIFAEECIEIADNSISENVNVDRLRIETRKWFVSKLLPKQYGEHRLLEEKTEENERLKEELLALREKLDTQNKKEF